MSDLFIGNLIIILILVGVALVPILITEIVLWKKTKRHLRHLK